MFRKKERVPLDANAHRGAMMISLIEKGWADPNPSLATLAVHPLDDYPTPSLAYEQALRPQAEVIARLIGSGADEATVAAAATAALEGYRATAADMNETHYITRFDQVLSA